MNSYDILNNKNFNDYKKFEEKQIKKMTPRCEKMFNDFKEGMVEGFKEEPETYFKINKRILDKDIYKEISKEELDFLIRYSNNYIISFIKVVIDEMEFVHDKKVSLIAEGFFADPKLHEIAYENNEDYKIFYDHLDKSYLRRLSTSRGLSKTVDVINGFRSLGITTIIDAVTASKKTILEKVLNEDFCNLLALLNIYSNFYDMELEFSFKTQELKKKDIAGYEKKEELKEKTKEEKVIIEKPKDEPKEEPKKEIKEPKEGKKERPFKTIDITINENEALNGVYKTLYIDNEYREVYIPMQTSNNTNIFIMRNDKDEDIYGRVKIDRTEGADKKESKLRYIFEVTSLIFIIFIILIGMIALITASNNAQTNKVKDYDYSKYSASDAKEDNQSKDDKKETKEIAKDVSTSSNKSNNNNNNVTAKPKEVQTTSYNPYANYTGGALSSKNGKYNYLRIFDVPTSINLNDSINFVFTGADLYTEIYGKVDMYRDNIYECSFTADKVDYSANTRVLSLTCVNPGNYKAVCTITDDLGGMYTRTFYITVSNVYNNLYRDIYRWN